MPLKRPLLTGAAQPRTDTVARAMEILKDRDMPRPKADVRQNMAPGWKRSAPPK